MLTIAAWAGCVSGDPDRPVSTDARTGPSPSREGVTGRVLSPDRSPVAGAVVQPRSLDTPAKRVPELAVVTDGDGRYEWRLGPGEYEIAVSADGYRRSVVKATVRPGRTTTLDITLARP
jgi:hypothetical protein